VKRRWPLSTLCLAHALIFAWAAVTLPTNTSLITVVFTAAALLHGLVAVLATLGATALRPVWRAASWFSLILFLVLSWLTFDAAQYLAELYGALGEGIAVALVAALAPVALLTLPFALWGLAATGGLSGRRTVVVLLAIGLTTSSIALHARGRARAHPAASIDAQALAAHLPDWSKLPEPTFTGSLYSPSPVRCASPPGSAGLVSIIVGYLGTSELGVGRQLECVQAPASEIGARLGALLQAHTFRAPVKLDLITATAELKGATLPIESLALRPGLDGVCFRASCLTPWQLVGANHFVRFQPLPFIPDLRLGISGDILGQALGRVDDVGLQGLVRLETESWLITSSGTLQPLERLRVPVDRLDRERIGKARRAAEEHVFNAQDTGGIFRYVLDPYTGGQYVHDFVLPRQAGTTSAICETASTGVERAEVAHRSLNAMASWERAFEDGTSALVKPVDAPHAHLGDTALPAIAFLRCRSLLEQRGYDLRELDERVERYGRWLLAMQRPNGSFYPVFDVRTGAPSDGPDPLYAAGQAVYALSLWERLVQERTDLLTKEERDRLSNAVERAMSYFGGPYWDRTLLRAFYLEENWHCLAARASLQHHRHDAYEQFCVDYMEFKKRLILDEHSHVSDVFVGGQGFGNLLPPHNTPSAGLGETLGAAMAIKRARGESLAEDRVLLKKIVLYLIRRQWDHAACFACDAGKLAVGAFSESIASPVIRIDYLQHALSALAYGEELLELP